MSLSKHLSARRLVPALFPLAHADAASAAASRRARRRGAFVSTPPAPPPSPSSVRLAEPLPSLAPSRLALHNRILALLSPAAAATATAPALAPAPAPALTPAPAPDHLAAPAPAPDHLAAPTPDHLAAPAPALTPVLAPALTPATDHLAAPDQPPDNLAEAALLTRHALHSNCRPSSYTCVAVLAALLRARRLDDFFALHRFAIQAAVPPTAATHALYLSALAARRLPDSTLLHLRQIARPGSPVPPSPTAYRLVVKCLAADHGRLDDAVQLKDEMLASGFVGPDPHVYSLLMAGCVQASNGAKAVEMYQELQEKLGGEPVLDGIVYGSLMKAYFLMGMEEKAMECYEEVLGPKSEVRFGAESYTAVVDALGQNGRLEDALKLFDRMLGEHDPPLRIAVDVRSFSVMVDAYCAAARFEDAIAVFRRMGEYKVVPDVAAYNNLIRHLGLNRLVDEAEVLHKEMGEHSIVADEETYVLLMDACFRVDRTDDGVSYFDKMSELGLKPDASHYHKIVDGLTGLNLLDKAQQYFDQMREKEIGPSIATYEALLKVYVGVTQLDDATKVAKGILLDEKVVFRDEMRDLLEGALRGEGREDDIAKLYEDVEREKAETAVCAAEEKARAEALAREERAARRAVAAAKDEAAAKASAAAIEAILGHRRKTEGETEALATPNALDGGILSRLGLRSSGQGALQDTPLSTVTKEDGTKEDGQEPF